MKNSQHLKAYVELHPDNKMAWYLLGKEYAKNGQQGKANYCFNQAGEVYEAFEHSKVPSDMLREYEEGLLQAGRERDRRHRGIRRSLLLLVLLLLAMMPSAAAPGMFTGHSPSELAELFPKDGEDDSGSRPAATLPREPGRSGAGEGLAFTAQDMKNTLFHSKVADYMTDPRHAATRVAVLGMERSGRWLLWKKSLPLEFTVESGGNGSYVYQSYNQADCACQPPDPGSLTRQAEIWQRNQEELAVLWSAIKAYQRNTGKQPDSLGTLAGSFPGNWLAGTTPLMEKEFIRLNALTVEQAVQPGRKPDGIREDQVETALTAAGAAAEGKPFFTEPIAVIVDKQQHRLSIVSGSVILRNYEVGLGGDKTPQGDFTITDKVVNPNGRDNGEFGSRGLQLSDSNYAIHGTDEPDSIGRDESLGCIRMKREDVEELFALVPKGTKVHITKGVLPADLLVPKERFIPSVSASQNQTNPRKVYHWLN